MTITNENIEAWLLRYAENELNADEIAEVEACLLSHPEWAELLSTYDAHFRLPQQVDICYPLKHKLLRKSPRLLPWFSLVKYSVVAAIILLLVVAGIVVFQPKHQDLQQPHIAAATQCISKDTVMIKKVNHPSTNSFVSVNAKPSVITEAERDTLMFEEESLPSSCEFSDKDAFAAVEVEWVFNDLNDCSNAAQVTYAIYTDQLLEEEHDAEKPLRKSNLQQYVFGKVSHFVAKKIRENQ